MPTRANEEIERKFLVNMDLWKPSSASLMVRQGYLSRDRERIVRVRSTMSFDKNGAHFLAGYITIKGLAAGITRPEFEYEISWGDAQDMLRMLCLQPIIEKTRYVEVYDGHEWTVDVFSSHSVPTLAEIELKHEQETFALPPWAGAEVTDDPAYYNSNIAA